MQNHIFCNFININFCKGFHDGRITNLERKSISETGQERPVLLYRVEYNDGDREGETFSLSIQFYFVKLNLTAPPGYRFLAS